MLAFKGRRPGKNIQRVSDLTPSRCTHFFCGHAQPILYFDNDLCDGAAHAHSWQAALCRVRERIIR
jgi:hypothetical protein